MDENVGFGLIFLVIACGFALFAFFVFRGYTRINKVLNRAHEMSTSTTGTICDLVSVTRRNRSFRWKNEYPIVAYEVNGKTYKTALEFAEARKGQYQIGETCTVCYVPEEPDCCIVEEFRKKMQSSRTQKLVGLVILVIFTVNMLFGAISYLLGISTL